MNLWAPLHIENIQNPFPMYARLRETAPIYKSQTGEWIISRYTDVKAILKDSRFKSGNKLDWINRGIEYFNQKDQDLSSIATAINSFLLLINPPEHTQIRRWISLAWDNKEVDNIINNNINTLLSRTTHNKSFDLVNDFAKPLPGMTICSIMGISLNMHEQLTILSNTLVKVLNLYNSFKDLVRIETASKSLIDLFEGILNSKKQNPGHDLICRLIEVNKKENEPLSDQQLISILIFIFIAGQETTVGLISTGLLNLSKHPGQLTKLINQPELISSTIEELLRYDGPVHLLGRIAKEDVIIDNNIIRRGDTITLCLASANRDSNQFENPDQLDISRSPNRHIAFGSGIHFCLGDWLAKRQGALALERFLKAHPKFEIINSIPQWNDNLSIRTLSKLICRIQ